MGCLVLIALSLDWAKLGLQALKNLVVVATPYRSWLTNADRLAHAPIGANYFPS